MYELSSILLSDATKYAQEVPALNIRREINFYAYMKGKKDALLCYTLRCLYGVEQNYTASNSVLPVQHLNLPVKSVEYDNNTVYCDAIQYSTVS